jgi:hypothetical protein
METTEVVFEERLNKMDTADLDDNWEKSEAVAEQHDDPKEEAAEKIVGALEDRHEGRNLAVGHRRQPKKRTQDDCGSRQKLAAARGRFTRRAILSSHKEHGHQGPGRDSVVRGAPKGRSFRKRRRAQPECNNKGLKPKSAATSRKQEAIQQKPSGRLSDLKSWSK